MRLLEEAIAASAVLIWRGLIPRIPPKTVSTLGRLLFSKSWSRFEKAVLQPRESQRERLLDIVGRARDTMFGREHAFSEIRSIEDFQRRVPIRRYEDFEPYISRMTSGQENVLVSEPVRYFARTSGTTGAAKFIPVTERYLEEYRCGRRVWSRQVSQVFPGLVRGSLLTMHSPKIEGHTKAGTPYGSITVAMGAVDQGSTGRWQVLKPFQRIPMDIFFIEEFNAKYYVLLRTALVTDISIMAAINPSTLVLMCRKLTEFSSDLIRDCERGTLRDDLALEPDLRATLLSRYRPERSVAERLRASLSANGFVRPIDVWPNLCGLLCWKGGSAPFYLQQFGKWFGDLPVMDYGYAATEGNFSVVLSADGSGGVLSVGGHFLEFIPEEYHGTLSPPVLSVDQLELGKRYCVIVTGSHGLYRYDINDVIEVVGMYRRTPEIVFCHKGGNMISYTGEKIGESHAVRAVTEAQEKTGISLEGFCVTVRLDSEIPRYVFAVEPSRDFSEEPLLALLRACEIGLRRANIEYDAKRKSLRLGEPVLVVVRKGAFDNWRRQRILSGAFDSHLKLPHIHSDPSVLNMLGEVQTIEARA